MEMNDRDNENEAAADSVNEYLMETEVGCIEEQSNDKNAGDSVAILVDLEKDANLNKNGVDLTVSSDDTSTTLAVASTKRRLRKDDSGIDFDSMIDCETDDESGNVRDIDVTGANSGDPASSKEVLKLHRSKVKKTEEVSEKSSPDSGHQDGDVTEMEYFDVESDREVHVVEEESVAENNAEVLRSNENEDSELRTNVFSNRRNRRERDNLEEEEEAEQSSSVNSSDDETDDVPLKPKPKYAWWVCKEVNKRQYGVSNNYSNDLFRLRSYGSLHMVERLELMYKMKKHSGCVNALHFNSSGTRLVSGSDDLCIVIWDWSIGEHVLGYDSGHRSNIFQTKFMPLSNDCHIVSCARDGQVRLAELSTTGVCKETRRVAVHRGPVHKLSLEPCSPHTFLSCGEDGVVFKIDLRENKPNKLLLCKENDRKVPLYSVHAHPLDQNEFAIGGKDHFVRVYDTRKLRDDEPTLKKYCPHHLLSGETRAHVTCAVYNYNGSELLVSYNDEDIYTFDNSHSDGADYIRRFSGHRNSATVKGVNYFGPKSEFVVSGSDCGNIYVWDCESEAVVQFMPGDEGGVVNCLESHPHIPILATSGLDDDIKIWIPSCERPPKLKRLRSTMRTNRKEREDERRQEPDTIDGQMLWFLMHHLRRTARRTAREDGPSADVSTGDDEDSSESDGSDVNPHAVQCSPS